jgi:hypothetical protein
MLSGDMAREQIQDRMRVAANERQAASVRRAGTRKGGSGLLAAFASLRPRSSEAPARVARTAV